MRKGDRLGHYALRGDHLWAKQEQKLWVEFALRASSIAELKQSAETVAGFSIEVKS